MGVYVCVCLCVCTGWKQVFSSAGKRSWEVYFPYHKSPGRKNKRVNHIRVLPQICIEVLVMKLVGTIREVRGEYQREIPFLEGIKG